MSRASLTFRRLSLGLRMTLMVMTILCISSHAGAQRLLHKSAHDAFWRINRPPVKAPVTDFPNITFQLYDEVVITAGGCAQTGGHGDTWKRYVNPSGGSSDRLYHGRIFIPGATAGLVRISSVTSPYQPLQPHLVVNKLPPHYDGSPLFLKLGYEDDNYGDNGYWGHDDGNNDQCREDADGGPAWIEIQITHHSAADAPPSPQPVAPLDLWWTEVDDNFLPLNPTWWYMEQNGTPPPVNSLCNDFHNEDDAFPLGKSLSCTVWDPEINERGIASICGPSGSKVAGHINWAMATYTGKLFFDDYSGGWPNDADYNFSLLRDDLKGATWPPHHDREGKPTLLLEFDSKETVDRMQGKGLWWDTFHHMVDNDVKVAEQMVQGREAIAVGLLGIDHNVHHDNRAYSELHPVYGLAIHLDDTPEGQMRWAILARNRGDEGNCSQQDERLDLYNNTMSFFIPKPPETTIAEEGSGFYTINAGKDYGIKNLDDGVLISKNLGAPGAKALFWGVLLLKREQADLTLSASAAPDPVVTGSDPHFTKGLTYTITVANNGPDRAHPVTVTEMLPDSAKLVSCSADNGGVCTNDPHTPVTFPSLEPGVTATITLNVNVDCSFDTGSVVSNTLSVSSPTADSDKQDNQATIETKALDIAPEFTHVPPDVEACTEPDATVCGTVVNIIKLGVVTAIDNCPGVQVTRNGVPAKSFYPVGTTDLTYTATDAHGHTTLAHQKVIVKDCTPPVIGKMAVDKSKLWPADHQMQRVTVNYVVTDNCPLQPNPCALSATSTEPANGTGPEDFSPDWKVEDANHIYLRAERAGDDKQRVYQITNTCQDAAGNVSKANIDVIVPTIAPLVDFERTQQSNLIENKLLMNLPNIARDPSSYIFTVPGVTNANIPRFQREGLSFGLSGFSVGGSDGRRNELTVDGGENQDGSGNIRFLLGPEAFREIEVKRNSSPAEDGFASGAAVNFVTNSGTNKFHASFYGYVQPHQTTARNPFNFNHSNTTDRQAVPGLTFAGPLIKGKLYIFTNYEHLSSDDGRFRTYNSSPQLQPTTEQLALLNTLAASTDNNVRRIANNLRSALTTAPNNYPATFNLLTANSGTSIFRVRSDAWMFRLDYQVTHTDSLGLLFSLARRKTSGIAFFNADTLRHSDETETRDATTLINWRHEFKVNLINRLRFQFSPQSRLQIAPSNPASTSLTITDFANFGRSFDSPFDVTQNRYQLDDDLAWLKGEHTFRFGFSYRRASYRVQSELGLAGDWTFMPGQFPISLAVPASDRDAFLAAVGTAALPTLSGLQSFNLNLPSLYRQAFGSPVWKGQAHYLGIFAGDRWKIHPHLTLDYGARLDSDTGPAPLPHHTYLSPRLGFAWDVNGKHKTIIRGGAGVFHGTVGYQAAYLTSLLNGSSQQFNEILKTQANGAQSPAALWNAGRALPGKLPSMPISQADLTNLGVQTGTGAPDRVLFQINKNFRNPYAVQASLGLQQQITQSLGIELAYQIYHDVHLPRALEINYSESTMPNPYGAAFGPFYQRIVPNIARLTDYQSTGNSISHGMTVSLTKRFSNYFQFQSNYTLTKTISDQFEVGTETDAAFPTRLFLERGLSTFDIRHNFVTSAVFESPFKGGPGQSLLSNFLSDTTLSPLIFIRSGIPFTLRAGADTNGDTHIFDRLFQIGRNTGIGPNFRSVDLRYTKAIPIRKETIRLLFIMEIENLFNRTNFAAVNEVLGTNQNSPDYNSGTFRLKGRRDRDRTQPLGFTDAFAARRFQFGLKMTF